MILYVLSILYVGILIYAFIINWHGQYFMMCFAACITPFILPTLLKLLHIKAPIELYILNIIFVFFASLWGSCLGGYTLPYYDKFTHFGSGILICELAYILYKHYLRNDDRVSLMCIFINALNAAVALCWEFYEYALLVFFNYDAIRHVATGVHDSITDMLVAILGGILLTIYLVRYDRDDEDHFFVSIERKLYRLNKKESH